MSLESLRGPLAVMHAQREKDGDNDADRVRAPRASAGLSLEGLTVTFGKVRALRDVSVAVESGEVLMMAGPNGAGKSTLIRVLLGLVRPEAGRISLGGRRVAIDRAFKTRLGYLPEAIAFSDNLTGQQVLRFFAHARAVDKRRVLAVLERVGLAGAAKRKVRGYSRGMRQRLGLGIAILAEPQLLVLDEPTGGLDQEGLDVLFDVLSEWRDAGRMVLMATHDLTLLERRVDRVCVLQSGRCVADATPAALRRRAGLPVRVTFEIDGDGAVLERAIADWGKAELSVGPGRITALVPPTELLALMDLRATAPLSVTDLRVEEPGMDEVYEGLLAGDQSEVGEGSTS